MLKNNHGVNVHSVRVCALIKLEKELLRLDELVASTVDLVNMYDALNICGTEINMGLTKLKKFREYTKLKLKYLKQDEFSKVYLLSKDCRVLYIKTKDAQTGGGTRVRIPNDINNIYLKLLIESNLIYLLLDNPEMLQYEKSILLEPLSVLMSRINSALMKLESKEN